MENAVSKGAALTSTPGLVDAILEVGRQRKTVLDQLRCALESGDNERALVFARQLCGMETHEKSNRVN